MNIHAKTHKKYFSTFFPFQTFFILQEEQNRLQGGRKNFTMLCVYYLYYLRPYVLCVRIRRNYVSTDPEITFPIKILIKTAVCAETSC